MARIRPLAEPRLPVLVRAFDEIVAHGKRERIVATRIAAHWVVPGWMLGKESPLMYGSTQIVMRGPSMPLARGLPTEERFWANCLVLDAFRNRFQQRRPINRLGNVVIAPGIQALLAIIGHGVGS
jgi:hypothetical protein